MHDNLSAALIRACHSENRPKHYQPEKLTTWQKQERREGMKKRGGREGTCVYEKYRNLMSTYVWRDMNTADVPCLHEEHVVFEGVSAWIREYTVLHHDVHEAAKKETTQL